MDATSDRSRRRLDDAVRRDCQTADVANEHGLSQVLTSRGPFARPLTAASSPRNPTDDGDLSHVGQAFEPDVSLERLTYLLMRPWPRRPRPTGTTARYFAALLFVERAMFSTLFQPTRHVAKLIYQVRERLL